MRINMKREESKLRNEDVALSDKIYSFLDETFYKTEATNFSRVTDKERQTKGIDTIFNIGDRAYVCDEKAAVRYRNLKTFSLELSFIDRNNEVKEGWLLDNEHINDSFLFVWIDNYGGEADQVEVALVRKEAIIDYLSSLGWTENNLNIKQKLIRQGQSTYMGDIKKDGCKFTFSRQLVEQPINILLPRSTYERLADKIWTSFIK